MGGCHGWLLWVDADWRLQSDVVWPIHVFRYAEPPLWSPRDDLSDPGSPKFPTAPRTDAALTHLVKSRAKIPAGILLTRA